MIFLKKDADKNVIDGDVIVQDSRNCLILAHERLIAANRLQNLVVVETPDAVFVSDLEHSRDVKSMVANLKQEGRREYHRHHTVSFPWGSRTLLEEKTGVAITRLILNPGASMELDAIPDSIHHLVVLEGDAEITGKLQSQILKRGKSAVYTNPIGIHIKNKEKQPLTLIQIQLISSA